jgi:[protein-PII] uridylyltransferase
VSAVPTPSDTPTAVPSDPPPAVPSGRPYPAPVGAPLALAAVRDAVLARGAVGHALRDALATAYDRWLTTLSVPAGACLVAVGGLGRREMAPYSDLDLVLVWRDAVVLGDADGFWYPLWDSGVPLDHATRTVAECLAVAEQDLPALIGMLWARPVAGDAELALHLRERIRRLWRGQARRRIAELAATCRQRWQRAGDGASSLEPDLKLARGGLRDAQVLQALAVAQLADVRVEMRRAHGLLLDVRGELHRQARRRGDVLRRQYLAAAARGLGLGAADDVLREVNLACRAVGHELDGALRRVAEATSARRTPGGPVVRRPLARDLVADAGEVALARSARVGPDPLLMLRAARVASETALPLAPYLVRRFAERTTAPPVPWPEELRAEFVRLLGGPAVIEVVTTLDLAGLMTTLLPAWAAVRGRAQHNPVHRHTVDRHLVDVVAAAAEFLHDVSRPDLLLVAALLHDIGKIGAGDHAKVGAPIARDAATAMGFDADDAALVAVLVRHHLLLVDTATGRDLDDARTVAGVLDAIGGRLDVLDLLYALTRADAKATGPAAWTPWRATLVADLVRRVRARAHGLPVQPAPTLPRDWWALAESTDLAVLVGRHDGTGAGVDLTVIAPDRIGVLNRTAGVLALHGLDVRSATIRSHAGRAVNTYHVEPLFGDVPDPAVLRGDLARTLAGADDLRERLETKERDYRRGPDPRRTPVASWPVDAATDAALVEVRADGSLGSLFRVTAALECCGLDVRAARVRSRGGTVIDTFYVRYGGSAPIPPAVRTAVDDELARTSGAPPHPNRRAPAADAPD